MIEVLLSEDDESRLASLFETLSLRKESAEACKVGTKERALAYREVTAVMRQIEDIVPPATSPLV